MMHNFAHCDMRIIDRSSVFEVFEHGGSPESGNAQRAQGDRREMLTLGSWLSILRSAFFPAMTQDDEADTNKSTYPLNQAK